MFRSSASDNFFGQEHMVRGFLYTDYIISDHDHDFYEMNIIMNGRGIHKIESSCFYVKTGDVFMIPPMTKHAYFETENLDVYHVLIRRENVAQHYKEGSEIPGYLAFVEIEPFLRMHFPDAMFLHLSKSGLMTLKEELKILDDQSKYSKKEWFPLQEHAAWKMIYILSGLLYEQTRIDIHKEHKKNEYAVIQSLEYIHQNYGGKIRIDDLCREAYMSRATFFRNFMDICGCTPSNYLNQYRLKKVNEILEYGNVSKTEAAQMCGFYDLSHMERTYRQLLTKDVAHYKSEDKIIDKVIGKEQ